MQNYRIHITTQIRSQIRKPGPTPKSAKGPLCTLVTGIRSKISTFWGHTPSPHSLEKKKKKKKNPGYGPVEDNKKLYKKFKSFKLSLLSTTKIYFVRGKPLYSSLLGL